MFCGDWDCLVVGAADDVFVFGVWIPAKIAALGETAVTGLVIGGAGVGFKAAVFEGCVPLMPFSKSLLVVAGGLVGLGGLGPPRRYLASLAEMRSIWLSRSMVIPTLR